MKVNNIKLNKATIAVGKALATAGADRTALTLALEALTDLADKATDTEELIAFNHGRLAFEAVEAANIIESDNA
jgi:hypothetical protein